jgi:membrane protein DedA with SNARE-associated domain
MVLPISAAVLMMIVVGILIKRSGLKAWHAFACTLLGFYLASSSIAPSIKTVTTSVAGMLTGIKL